MYNINIVVEAISGQLRNPPGYESLCILLDTSVYCIQGKWYPDTAEQLRIFLHSPLDISNPFGRVH